MPRGGVSFASRGVPCLSRRAKTALFQTLPQRGSLFARYALSTLFLLPSWEKVARSAG